MAQQIQRELNRQKVPPKPKREKRPGMDDDYRLAIKQLPCCTCQTPPPSDPSHLKQDTGERGLGRRSSDRWLVPQCRPCHDELERAGSRNESLKRSRAAVQGQLTKVKNRVKFGVCPCCNRTFQNLQRHMEKQHPDFNPAEKVG